MEHCQLLRLSVRNAKIMKPHGYLGKHERPMSQQLEFISAQNVSTNGANTKLSDRLTPIVYPSDET